MYPAVLSFKQPVPIIGKRQNGEGGVKEHRVAERRLLSLSMHRSDGLGNKHDFDR